MKKLIVLCLILFLSFPLAAEIRVALIGDKDKTDLLMAELSEMAEVALLERAEIEKIMQEQKLSAVNGADLCRHFPHADVIGIVSPVSVSFFNAKNGFKLGRLAIEDAEAEKTVALLKKTTDKNSILLSIGFVTLTDIPERIRPAIGRILFEMEEFLSNSEKIQLLEREHLSAVLQERELSGTAQMLIPSLQVIRCDFTQGHNAEIIDLNLTLTDGTGKSLFRKKYTELDGGAVPAQDVAHSLNSPGRTVQTYDRRREAELYLKEYYAAYERLNPSAALTDVLPADFSSLRKYVDAMYVLAPENPRYVYEKLYYELCFVMKQGATWRENIVILRKFLDGAKRFLREYPDFRFPYGPHFNSSYGFQSHPVLKQHPASHIYYCQDLLPPAEDEAELISAMDDELRAIHLEIYRRFTPRYLDAPAKVKDWDTFAGYAATVKRKVSFQFFDKEKLLQETWDAEFSILKKLAELLEKAPSLKQKAEWYITRHYFRIYDGQFRGIHRRKEAWARMRKILNTELDAFAALAGKIKAEKLDIYVEELYAMKDYLNSPGTQEDFMRCYTALITKLLETKGKSYHQWRQRWIGYHALSPAAEEYFRIGNQSSAKFLAQEKELAIKMGIIKITDKDRVVNAVRIMDDTFPGEQIRALAFEGICNNSIGKMLQNYGASLYRKKNQTRLDELNRAFEIERIPFPRSWWSKAYLHCAAELYKNKLYLLSSDEKQNLRFYECIPEKRKIRELEELNITRQKFIPGFLMGSVMPIMTGCNGKILIGGYKSIAVYDIGDDEWHIISELPGEYINGLHYDGKRIYYLCGGPTQSSDGKMLSMHSCTLDGSERKTYYNELNISAIPDGNKAGASSGLFPAGDGKLLFTMTGKNKTGLLVSFDPASEKFEVLHKHPVSGNFFSIRRNGDFLLGNDGPFFGCSFFKLYPDKSLELFFTQGKNDKRQFRHRIKGYHSFICHPAVLAEDRYLVGGSGYGNWFLDLQNPEKSPLLLLPRALSVFYLPEEKMFIFPSLQWLRGDTGDIYLVKLKEQKEVEKCKN